MARLKLTLCFTLLIIHLKFQVPLVSAPKSTDFVVGQTTYNNPNYMGNYSAPTLSIPHPESFNDAGVPIVSISMQSIYYSGDLPYQLANDVTPQNQIYFRIQDGGSNNIAVRATIKSTVSKAPLKSIRFSYMAISSTYRNANYLQFSY